MSSKIQNLPTGDQRAAVFCDKLIDFIRICGHGLPYPTVLGCIDIAKAEIMKTQDEEHGL